MRDVQKPLQYLFMSNKQQFQILLDAYLEGRITPDEQIIFMKLIKSGEYDALLKDQLDQSLLLSSASADMGKSRAEDLLQRILNSEGQTAKLIPLSTPSHSYHHRWIAAAVVLSIVALSWWLIPDKTKTRQQAAVSTRSLEPAKKGSKEKFIRLPDGSTVLLNEGSHLEYPDEFRKNKREVVLVGEGYFDIKHDASRPFIVQTGKVHTTVLGTAFNIKAYPGQEKITVTVTRGKVSVSNANTTLGVITPNESISVNTANNQYVQEKVDAEELVEWKKQYLIIDDLSLREAAALIKSKYHVSISFSNDQIKDCRISARFLDNENLEHVLSVITGIINASYTLQPNDQVIITGEGCSE